MVSLPVPLDLTDWIQLIVALFTGAAAWAAWASARASKRASEANLFSSLVAQYSAPEMLEALRALEQWRRSLTPDFTTGRRAGAGAFFEGNVRGWAKNISSHDPSDQAQALNQQRRRVTQFFSLVARLIQEGELTAGFADELRELSGRHILYQVAIPMELALQEASATSNVVAMRRLERLRSVFFPDRHLPSLPPAT